MEEYERYLSRANELPQAETNDIEMTTNSSSKNRAPSSPDIREQVKKKRIRLRLPPLGRLRRRKAIAQMDDARGTLFGRSVADLFQGETLNPQLMWLLKILHEQGPSASGIFRRTSNINACRKIKNQMENGAECEQINVYMASNVLKEVLRSLSDCVLCCDKYDQWLECPLSKEHLKRMVYGLPFHNRHLLRHLICVLHAIQRSVAVSMMSSHSLAICFGPSLLWSRRTSAAASSAAALEGQKAADVSRIVANVGRVIGVVEALIDNAEAVFGADCLRLLQGTTAADQNVMTKTADDDREYLDQTVVCREKNPANSSSTERVSLPPGGNSERPVAPPRHKRAKSLRTAADKTARLGLPADYSNHRMKTEELPGFDDQLTSIDSEMSWSELRDQLAESTDDALDDSASYEEISVTEEELDDREGDGGPKRSSMFSCRSEELGHQGGVVEDRFSLRLGRSVSVDYVETASKRQPTKRPEATMDRGRTTLGGFTRRINALLAATNVAPVGSEFSSSSDHLKSLGAESSGDVLSTETSEARRNRRPSYKSFSSTDELLLDGHRLVSGDGRVFFSGNSFSSTAGSDADLSTFGESMDGESAFARLNFLSGLENRKSYDDEKSGSSVVVSGSKLKSGGGETRTVPKITIDVAVDSASRDQARDSVERGPTDVIEVTGESRDSIREAKVVGGDVHQRVIYRTDAGDDDVRQHPGISSRSSSVSRSVPETKQRRGMTGSGSDVFPSHLSKTYRLKKAHLCSSDALDYDSASGTESGVDAGGTGGGGGSSSNWRLRPPRGSGKAVVEERMVESDLERVADRRWEETNQRNSEPIDTLRQWDSDTGEQRSARRNSIEKKADLPRNLGESSRKETPSTADYLSAALQGEESKRENSKAEEAAKVRTETVRSDSPKTAASQVTRSCSDLPKTLDLYLVTSRRSEEQDQLRHHSSVGSIADSALQKKLHPRRLRHLISTSDSDSSDESGKRADDGGQTRRKRRRNRRPRRSRGSDPRIQTVRTNNRVNLVRSKSDSNALCRTELIIKKESNCALEDGQGKTGIFTKYTADLANINVSKDDNNNNNKQNGRAVKVGGPDLEVGTQNKENELNLAELLSTEPGTRCRRQVTMKDRSWHQELVEELSASKYPPRQTQSSSGRQGGKAAKQVHGKGIGLHENKSNASKTSSNALASQPTDEPTTGTRSNQGTGARLEGNRAAGNNVGRPSEGAIEAKTDVKFRGGGGDWDSNSAADDRKVSALERNHRIFGKSVDNLHASSSSLVRISRTANEAEDLHDGGADFSEPDTRHFSGNRRRAHSFKTIAGELSAASRPPASHGANPNAADDLKKVETDSGEFSLRTVESIKRSLLSGRPCDQNRPRHSGSISRPPQKPRPTTDTESRIPGKNDETSRLENSKSLNRSVSLTAHRTPGRSHLYVYDQLKSELNTKPQTSERRDSELRDYSKDSSNLRKHIAGEIRSPKDAKNTSDSRNAQPSVSKIAGKPSFLSPETHRPRGIQPTANKPSPFASAMSIDDPREEDRFTSSNSVVSGDVRGDTSSDDCSSSSGSPSTRADRGARRAASRSVVGNPGKSEMPWSVASIRSYFGGQDSV